MKRRNPAIVVLALVFSAACGGSRPVADPLPVEEPVPRAPDLVVYRWLAEPGDAPKLTIEIELRGEDDGTTPFGLATSWGPAGAIHLSVTNPRAIDESGEALDVAPMELQQVGNGELAVWSVSHPPGALIRFRWDVTNDHEPRRKTTRHFYGPVVRSDLIHVLGPFLVIPLRLPPNTSTLQMDFTALEALGWDVATSLHPPAASFERRIRVDRMSQSVFYAGADVRITRREVDEQPVFLAISGAFRFDDDELAELLQLTVKLQRDFFDEHDVPHFLVTVLPNNEHINPETPQQGEVGTSLANSFAALLNPTASLRGPSAIYLKNLFGHEMLHQWVSHRIYLSPGASTTSSWFYEGFTTYMTAELMYRGGLISTQEYLDQVNGYVTKYQRSPLRTATSAEAAQAFWKGGDGHDIAYNRGAVLAAMLDREVRRASDGERRLDHLLREMVAHSKSDGPLDEARFLELVGKHTSSEFAIWFRERAVDGLMIELPEDLLGERFTGKADGDGVMEYGEVKTK